MKDNKKERDPLWELILAYIGLLFGFSILAMAMDMLLTVWKGLFE
jgi:uncharacterized membrane protein YcjF (UPF0283 family)